MTFKKFMEILSQSKPSSRLIAGLLIIGIAFCFNPTIDNSGKEHIDRAFNRALITFGIARALNGVISVAQGTELAIQPAGIGVNLTPGQILDPVNDIVERFSWVMLASATALGIQKTFLIISHYEYFNYFLIILFSIAVILLFSRLSLNEKIRSHIIRIALVLLVLRFAVPAFVILNNIVYQAFHENEFITASTKLESTTQSIAEINQDSRSKQPNIKKRSVWESAKEFYQSTSEMFDIDKRIESYKTTLANTSKYIIDLVVIFIFQTVILPLIFLVLVYKLCIYLLKVEVHLPVKNNHSVA